jgi:hypothetical protein
MPKGITFVPSSSKNGRKLRHKKGAILSADYTIPKDISDWNKNIEQKRKEKEMAKNSYGKLPPLPIIEIHDDMEYDEEGREEYEEENRRNREEFREDEDQRLDDPRHGS